MDLLSETTTVETQDAARRKRKSGATSFDSDLRVDRPAEKQARSSFRHEKHWDLEGDIFLPISDCWMRLRRSILSKHSEWFSGVFAAIEEGRILPDPKRPYMVGTMILVDVKNVRKCYHVSALGISAMDFDLLLNALDDAMY
ncbi:hypothetical protein MVEN_02359700 [Mycena venus]|uniref:BTB domain-containing protein n=1 Tax=Mycena venus TaxID=2733690 RepID=A0A8H6X2X8_9AGAR|nr:hypothetical protein MVEN_02359700 [Mycena venus]